MIALNFAKSIVLITKLEDNIMSEQTEYCTTKDLGKAFAVIVFMIIGVPILALMTMVGLEDYARYCSLSWIPCFGID